MVFQRRFSKVLNYWPKLSLKRLTKSKEKNKYKNVNLCKKLQNTKI